MTEEFIFVDAHLRGHSIQSFTFRQCRNNRDPVIQPLGINPIQVDCDRQNLSFMWMLREKLKTLNKEDFVKRLGDMVAGVVRRPGNQIEEQHAIKPIVLD
jgi:hypothetical protein